MGHSDLEVFKRQKRSEQNFRCFPGKRHEFRRKRDLYEPLLTAMARVLTSLKKVEIVTENFATFFTARKDPALLFLGVFLAAEFLGLFGCFRLIFQCF